MAGKNEANEEIRLKECCSFASIAMNHTYYNEKKQPVCGSCGDVIIKQWEAVEWLLQNEHKRYLGHGTSNRHEAKIRRMRMWAGVDA